MQTLKLISYNAQNGIATSSYPQYLTGGWKHVLPYRKRMLNLDRIAAMLTQADIVALQEVDAGSLRSNHTNLTKYLAQKGAFEYSHTQTNRDIGQFAQHSSGVLSRFAPDEVCEYKLPGVLPGRGALVLTYKMETRNFYVIIVHLSLTARARQRQLAFIAELLQEYRYAAVMGDFNCESHSREMRWLFAHSHLIEPLDKLVTFPSWAPKKNIDHILITSGLTVESAEVIDFPLSDHLPIMMDIVLPERLNSVIAPIQSLA